MNRPYELSYVDDRFVVNGFALPIPKPLKTSHPKYTAQERAQIAFVQRVGDAADSLRAAGISPMRQGEVIRSMCAASLLVDSVTVTHRGVIWRFLDGQRVSVELAGRWVPVKQISRQQMQLGELTQMRALLERGATVFILANGSRITAIENADTLVSRALAGKLPGSSLEAELRSPVPLERVK
jgi:hypothetical protein